ncbi:hypothetical protein Ancab_003255 [Ancistrocladus abbreviatus]
MPTASTHCWVPAQLCPNSGRGMQAHALSALLNACVHNSDFSRVIGKCEVVDELISMMKGKDVPDFSILTPFTDMLKKYQVHVLTPAWLLSILRCYTCILSRSSHIELKRSAEYPLSCAAFASYMRLGTILTPRSCGHSLSRHFKLMNPILLRSLHRKAMNESLPRFFPLGLSQELLLHVNLRVATDIAKVEELKSDDSARSLVSGCRARQGHWYLAAEPDKMPAQLP